jgi:hypothetical protein
MLHTHLCFLSSKAKYQNWNLKDVIQYLQSLVPNPNMILPTELIIYICEIVVQGHLADTFMNYKSLLYLRPILMAFCGRENYKCVRNVLFPFCMLDIKRKISDLSFILLQCFTKFTYNEYTASLYHQDSILFNFYVERNMDIHQYVKNMILGYEDKRVILKSDALKCREHIMAYRLRHSHERSIPPFKNYET